MKWPSLTARDRRAITIGAPIGVLALAWTLLVAPYARAVQDVQGQLDADRPLLQRELEMLAAQDRYPAVLDEGRRVLRQAAPHLLGETSRGSASAALVAYLRARAREADVVVTEMAPLEDSSATDGGLAGISLQAEGRGDLKGVLTLLQSLEAGAKLVRVDQLEINAAEPTDAPAGSDGGGGESLTFRFVITGYAPAAPAVLAALSSGEAAR